MARLELYGQPVSPGIGTGSVVLAEQPKGPHIPRHIQADQVVAALQLFEAARERAIGKLSKVQAATSEELGIEDAAIYGAQIAILQDPSVLQEIRTLIAEKLLAAESAIQAAVEKFGKQFEQLEGGDIKNWAADLRDPWHAVGRELAMDSSVASPMNADQPIILVAEELVPSLVTRYPRESLAGIVCRRGGRFSHGAVVARSFGIPTVTGLDQIEQKAQPGETAVVYADKACLLLGVEAEELEAANRRKAQSRVVQDALRERALQPAATADGHRVAILANIESPRDLGIFDTEVVDGVGLFRTEFAYMERPTFPSVQEQADLYRRVLETFEGKPVVFRTLDIGNDKTLRYFTMPQEANPALGWRGLRLGLEWKDLLLAQIQALIDCQDAGDVRILLPMVTVIEEVRQVRKLIKNFLPADTAMPPLGCMVEVPSAALALADIAAEVDFVSVGTNDLVQYLFAVDRDNPWVTDLYQPFHPAHLRLLLHIAQTCKATGTPVSVCGEMAGQPEGALFLVGAGFDQLSVAPPFVSELKAILGQVQTQNLQEMAHQAAACQNSEEAFEILETAAHKAWAQVVDRFQGCSG
jgi:phosphoenolpyruvate-protein phosphotransferase (PTS system enzyme I)